MDWRKPLRPFLDLKYLSDSDFGAGSGVGLDECLPSRGSAHLLLCTYGEEEIRAALKTYGVEARLRTLGFADYDITIDASDPERQRLQLHGKIVTASDDASQGTPVRLDKPLGDVILREAVLEPTVRVFRKARPFSFLVIQWIRLQNPALSLPARQLLPGQDHPGLGLGETVVNMFKAMARKRGREGVINRPEFLHNAILYSRHFHFLNPEVKGRLMAIQRDLPNLSLRQLSWAADRGLIIENQSTTYFRWFQAEQVWPNCVDLRVFLRSAAYRRTAEKAFETFRYHLVDHAMEALAELCEA